MCRILQNWLVSPFFFFCLPALKLEGAVLYLVPGLNTFSLIYMYLEIYSEFSQFYLSHFAITPGINTIGNSIPGIVLPSIDTTTIHIHFLTLISPDFSFPGFPNLPPFSKDYRHLPPFSKDCRRP